MRMRQILAFSLLFSFTSDSAFACDGILNLAQDISLTQRSSMIAASVYDEYCEDREVRSDANSSSGLDAVVDSVSIGVDLGSGSSSEKLSRFCSIYSSDFERRESSLQFAMSTNQRVVDAWAQCQELERSDVFFTVDPQRELLGFGVRRGAGIVDFLGMDYNPDHISCFGPFGRDGTEILIDKTTRFSLTSERVYPITCRRKLEFLDDGTQLLFPTEVSLEAQGRAPLIVPLSREERFEPSFASDVKLRQNAFEAQLLELDARLTTLYQRVGAEIDRLEGKWRFGKDVFPNARNGGTADVRIAFTPEFSGVPTVVATIADIPGDGFGNDGWSVSVFNVSKSGATLRICREGGTGCQRFAARPEVVWLAYQP